MYFYAFRDKPNYNGKASTKPKSGFGNHQTEPSLSLTFAGDLDDDLINAVDQIELDYQCTTNNNTDDSSRVTNISKKVDTEKCTGKLRNIQANRQTCNSLPLEINKLKCNNNVGNSQPKSSAVIATACDQAFNVSGLSLEGLISSPILRSTPSNHSSVIRSDVKTIGTSKSNTKVPYNLTKTFKDKHIISHDIQMPRVDGEDCNSGPSTSSRDVGRNQVKRNHLSKCSPNDNHKPETRTPKMCQLQSDVKPHEQGDGVGHSPRS